MEQTAAIQHLACIMDGNRRWARKQGLFPWQGHEQGLKTVEVVVNFCLEKGIKHLSLYTFSLENFKRSAQELNFMFNLFARKIEYIHDLCMQQEVRIQFVGDRTKFPTELVNLCDRLESETQHHTRLWLHILFCYGGRQEIVAATKQLIIAIDNGSFDINNLDTTSFTQFLWTRGIPDPDLIIRTGNRHCLSNFLPYQAAYSELYFLDCFWPELTVQHLQTALLAFEQTKRNFGQ